MSDLKSPQESKAPCHALLPRGARDVGAAHEVHERGQRRDHDAASQVGQDVEQS